MRPYFFQNFKLLSSSIPYTGVIGQSLSSLMIWFSNYQNCLKIYTLLVFFDSKISNIEATEMVKKVDWNDFDTFNYLSKGLSDGASQYSFFGRVSDDGSEDRYKVERLLDVCRAIPSRRSSKKRCLQKY
ncbi:MAG: hypothetical protein WCT51_02095 [Candidatus Shapirobacteria bacterium]